MPRALYTPPSGLAAAPIPGEKRMAYARRAPRGPIVYLGHASDCRCGGAECAEQARVEDEAQRAFADKACDPMPPGLVFCGPITLTIGGATISGVRVTSETMTAKEPR